MGAPRIEPAVRATETAEQRFDRLANELRTLRRIPAAERTDTNRARITALLLELRELAAVPPPGYTLPTAAVDLIHHARAHGWDAWAQWTHGEGITNPFVTVYAGRAVTDADLAAADQAGIYLGTGPRWRYELTWRSRDCPPGRWRRWRQGLAQTPDRPAPHDAPSVRGIQQVIEQNPAAGGQA